MTVFSTKAGQRPRRRLVLLLLALLAPGAATAPAVAAQLEVVAPAMECAALTGLDLRGLETPAHVASATVITEGKAQPVCEVRGYAAPAVNFVLSLPVEGWTQRLLALGCGGYCGTPPLNFASATASSSAGNGCPLTMSGELAVLAHDGGHQGSSQAWADGIWAVGNPGAVIDMAYASNHKATVAAKAIIAAYYGQDPAFSYFTGCSAGGRAALHVAQRYPDDYDGIIAGSPTIDMVETNTFYHAWNVRSNEREDGTAILTSDKLPALHAAVMAACADQSGFIPDNRGCDFDPATIQCADVDSADCLTAEQVEVVRKLYQGPVDENGVLLASGDMPYGSELTWGGALALKPGETFEGVRPGDYTWSYDWPNFIGNFEVTGITNRNIEFTSAQFDYLTKYSGLFNPTNPDLSAFKASGGKLLIWQGWVDSGTSPESALNYYDAVRSHMGEEEAAEFLSLYMIPGVGHCGGGALSARIDFISSMTAWVEDGTAPDRVVVDFTEPQSEGVARSMPAFPYPMQAVHDGSGDVNAAESYRAEMPKQSFPDKFDWAGSRFYTPEAQLTCTVDGLEVICS